VYRQTYALLRAYVKAESSGNVNFGWSGWLSQQSLIIFGTVLGEQS
jgi:hypothetical protein